VTRAKCCVRRAQCDVLTATCSLLRAYGDVLLWSPRPVGLLHLGEMWFHELGRGRLCMFTFVDEASEFRCVDDAALFALLQVVLAFRERRERITKELDDLGRFIPRESLREVAAHRPGSVAKAGAKSAVVADMFPPTEPKHIAAQLVGKPPAMKITRVPRSHARYRARCVPRRFAPETREPTAKPRLPRKPELP
jgi:hypothetical protein